jgi:GNAT superfamily N-acetyltransferase
LLTIRQADDSDAEMLVELGRRTFHETFADSNKAEDMDDYLNTAFALDRIVGELRNPTTNFFVAEISTKPVGFAKLEISRPPECVTGPSPVRLHKLYVTSEAIGTGVGAALMRFGIDWARTAGHESLWLGVWEHNLRARAFYERWGYRTVGTERFRLGSDDQIDLLMELNLTELVLDQPGD